jgi:hypothetical protein
MNPMQIMNAVRNPQAFLYSMINNPQIQGNPVLKNTVDMAKTGDKNGIEKLARNLCKEKGIDPDQAIQQLRNQFGIK